MSALLKLFFFSKVVLLTQTSLSVDAGIPHELLLDDPISAITSGAGVVIDVTEEVGLLGGEDVLQIRSLIKKRFPPGAIEIVLRGDDVKLDIPYTGLTIVGNDYAAIKISDTSIPIGVEFDKLVLKSTTDLRSITVYWRNFKK